MRDAVFRDIVVHDTRTAVDVVSSWWRDSRGVDVSDVTFDGMEVESVLLCRIHPNLAKEVRIGGIRFANVKGSVDCASWITGRGESQVGPIVFENVNLLHGVVCLNAPDVQISRGCFERFEPPPVEVDAYNRHIDEDDSFPCVFKGPLYDSIQKRRYGGERLRVAADDD